MGELHYPTDPVLVSEVWQLSEAEQVVGVHPGQNCTGPCPLHRPGHHAMREFPLHWRNDMAIFERICPHGVGHPDPDTILWFGVAVPGGGGITAASTFAVHGCDGCCGEILENALAYVRKMKGGTNGG